MGVLQCCVFVGLQATVKPKHRAVATSGLYLFVGISVIIGLACVNSVITLTMRKDLDLQLLDLGFDEVMRQEVRRRITLILVYILILGPRSSNMPRRMLTILTG